MTASPHHIPDAWPALLSKEQAAAYVGVSVKVLVRICTVAPVDLGANLVRYSRAALDAWIAGLPPRLKRARDRDENAAGPDPAPASADEADDRAQAAIARALRRAQGRGGQNREGKATISCAHRADLGQAALAAYPPATPLEAIAARLKCSKCGNAEGLVGTRSGGGGPRTGAR